MERFGWEIWGAVALLCLAGEVYTQHFVLLWIALGAGAAAVGAALGLSLTAEFILFSASSIALLAVARPIFWRLLSREGRALATNAEALPGQRAEVVEPLHGPERPGTVKVGGEQWAAFTEDGSELKPGESVRVVRVDGLKLCVKPSEEWKGRRPS